MRRLMRLLLPLVPLVMLAVALWRRVTGTEPAEALAERLGHVPGAAGPVIWLHGASNGELASARWVAEALLAARPDLGLLVTTNTATARAMVKGWNLPRTTVAFAPLDLHRPLARLLTAWRPRLLLTVEGEIYPRRFAACARVGVPVALIGARMSERSFRGWQGLQPVMADALAQVRLASAQDEGSARRLQALGLPPSAVVPACDLKAQAIARLPTPALPARDSRARCLLAASTHEGEEAAVLEAFAANRQFGKLILAPRHPRRADEIAALIAARNLSFARRSQGTMPGEEAVFLADTMGEMDLWYARAGACFVGGSLAPKGGHTPWEPARFACAILHGPSVGNFAGPYAALDSIGAVRVDTAEALRGALDGLSAARQEALAAQAARILTTSGDPSALIHAILTISAP